MSWYSIRRLLLFFAIAFGSLSANDVDADGWPIVRFQNGTVGVQNDGGEVHVRADVMKLHTNVLMLNDIDLIPPKCMAPGGDRLQHNGTHFFCVCVELWSGRNCDIPPSPPPSPPPYVAPLPYNTAVAAAVFSAAAATECTRCERVTPSST